LGTNKFAIIDCDKTLYDTGNILGSLTESQKSILKKIDFGSHSDLMILGKGIYAQKIGSIAIYNSGGDEVASVNIVKNSSLPNYNVTVQLCIGDGSTTASYTNVSTIEIVETYYYESQSVPLSSSDGFPVTVKVPTTTYIILTLTVSPLTTTQFYTPGTYTCTIPFNYNYIYSFTANNGIVYKIKKIP
jgi:hypothetical protein